MSTSHTFPVGTLVLFLVWLAVMAVAFFWSRSGDQDLSPELRAVLWPQPRTLGSITLVDQHRAALSEDRLRGHWTFVYFGYTRCPDNCPTSLSTLKQVSNQLSNDPEVASEVQYLFVSVDPDRDSPEVLGSYIAYFDDEFIGATGTRREIDQVVMQFGARYAKEEGSNRDTFLIRHTASFFLVDPHAQIVGAFSPPHNPDAITSLFKEIRGIYRAAAKTQGSSLSGPLRLDVFARDGYFARRNSSPLLRGAELLSYGRSGVDLTSRQ